MKVYIVMKKIYLNICNATRVVLKGFATKEAADKYLRKLYLKQSLKYYGVSEEDFTKEQVNTIKTLGINEITSYALLAASKKELTKTVRDVSLDTDGKYHLLTWDGTSMFVNPEEGHIWLENSKDNWSDEFGNGDPEDYNGQFNDALRSLSLRMTLSVRVAICDTFDHFHEEDDENLIEEEFMGSEIYPYSIEELSIEA
jgi:hypothetical protein